MIEPWRDGAGEGMNTDTPDRTEVRLAIESLLDGRHVMGESAVYALRFVLMRAYESGIRQGMLREKSKN